MIDRNSLRAYRGPAFVRQADALYLPPHPLLSPYIANYTISCPSPQTMPSDYTVLPTASASLVYAVDGTDITGGLRGVNSRATTVGAYANRFDLLVIIEFHPAGLYPFLRIPQAELLDMSFAFDALDAALDRQVKEALLRAPDVASLVQALDSILIHSLQAAALPPALTDAMACIARSGGDIRAKAVAQAVFYSEKHVGRLFQQHIGTGIKTFSRIVRVNRALHLLQAAPHNLASVAQHGGYFDQAHFIRDFQALCGVSPQAYLRQMSIFYNDIFKM